MHMTYSKYAMSQNEPKQAKSTENEPKQPKTSQNKPRGEL